MFYTYCLYGYGISGRPEVWSRGRNAQDVWYHIRRYFSGFEGRVEEASWLPIDAAKLYDANHAPGWGERPPLYLATIKPDRSASTFP